MTRLAVSLGAVLWLGWVAPAQAAAHRHHPHIDRSGRSRTGRASYYARKDAGKTTASGAAFAPRQMTAASRTLPLGTKAKVTNADTGKSVAVTVTDRGPFAKNRILDVSPKAADQLGMKDKGTAKVTVKPIALPPK